MTHPALRLGIRSPRPSAVSLGYGPEDNLRFGKVWLLPYHTGKDASQAHPVGHTWYDELIVSTSVIADPL